MSQYAHTVLAPKLSSKLRSLLFEYFTEYFNDGFEDGVPGNWGNVYENNGTIVQSSDIAKEGDYSALATVTAQGGYGVVAADFGTLLTTAFMRCYVYFTALLETNDRVIGFIRNGGDSGLTPAFALTGGMVYRNGSGEHRWRMFYEDLGDQTVDHPTDGPVIDEWYCVEIETVYSTVSAGISRMYVNGTQILEQTGLDNDANGQVEYIVVGAGAITGGGVTDQITLYVDSCIVADEEIGCIVEGIELSETLSITDTVSTEVLYLKEISESLSLLEAFGKVLFSQREYFENLGIADLAEITPGILSIVRSESLSLVIQTLTLDALQLIDIMSLTIQDICTLPVPGIELNESLSLLGVFVKTLSYQRNYLEDISIDDIISITSQLLREYYESLDLVDIISIARALGISGFESLEILDQISLSTLFLREYQESFNITDIITLEFFKELDLTIETMTITDIFSPIHDMLRELIEDFTIVDYVSIPGMVYQECYETLNIASFLVTQIILFRDMTVETLSIVPLYMKYFSKEMGIESISIVDIFGKETLYLRSFLEVLDIWAEFIPPALKQLWESLNIIDYISIGIGIVRQETLDIIDLFSRQSEYILELLSSLDIVDFFSKELVGLGEISRSESIGIVDIYLGRLDSIRDYIESLSLIEVFSLSKIITKIVTESLDIVSYYSRILISNRYQIETMSIEDIFGSTIFLLRTLLEDLSIIDIILFDQFKRWSEELEITDILTYNIFYLRYSFEEINIIDIWSYSISGLQVLIEQLGIQDILTTTSAYLRRLQLDLLLVDTVDIFIPLVGIDVTEDLVISGAFSRVLRLRYLLIEQLHLDEYFQLPIFKFLTKIESLTIRVYFSFRIPIELSVIVKHALKTQTLRTLVVPTTVKHLVEALKVYRRR